jgi:hypothetical protein
VSLSYKSGAFIQQCFAAHPLCLTVKKLTLPDRLVLACSSCRFHHHVRLRSLSRQSSVARDDREQPERQEPPERHLSRCAEEHPTALRLGGMDVLQERLALRCGQCRCLYTIEAAEFETRTR